MRFFTIFLLSLCSTIAFGQNVASQPGGETAMSRPDTVITVAPAYAEPVRKPDDTAHFFKGTTDADMYYTGYKGAGTGTLVVSLLSPLVGLIPAIACSVTPPRPNNLGYPNTERYNHPDYQNGYNQRARKIKSRKVWTNWGIGLGVNLLFALALSSK